MPTSALPPAHDLSREAVARRDLGHTTVSPHITRLLLAAFLVLIAAMPVAEMSASRTRSEDGSAGPWTHLVGIPGEVRSYFAGVGSSAHPLISWQRIVEPNRIVLSALSDFERTLEDESPIGRWLRPPAQVVMTGWLGAGNERVYPGRNGWLFYRPDVEYITRPGFLDRGQIARRRAAAPEWTNPPQPDPRPAIVQLKHDLDARGITLVLMPTPLKPGVHPEMLARDDLPTAGVLQNASYGTFVEGLRQQGVLVFDPSDTLASARRSDPQYLATDTHWRPEAMESVAAQLGDFITTRAALPETADPDYRIERVEVQNVGDVARMLDLPQGSLLFPPESVWLRRVLQAGGSAWRSSREADVLLLGDSFSNIYALESMGWGTSAGFAEQLSYNLRRPLDRLVQNSQGSFATRAMLQQDPGRLRGKRVVVYQFAARELSEGDWKVLPLPSAQR